MDGKKINRDFIKGGRGGGPPFYEVISQKIFFFANEGFPYRLTLRTFRGGTSEIKHSVSAKNLLKMHRWVPKVLPRLPAGR